MTLHSDVFSLQSNGVFATIGVDSSSDDRTDDHHSNKNSAGDVSYFFVSARAEEGE